LGGPVAPEILVLKDFNCWLFFKKLIFGLQKCKYIPKKFSQWHKTFFFFKTCLLSVFDFHIIKTILVVSSKIASQRFSSEVRSKFNIMFLSCFFKLSERTSALFPPARQTQSYPQTAQYYTPTPHENPYANQTEHIPVSNSILL